VGSTPVGSTPVGSTDVSASLLANIPLSDINPLPPVVNCTGSFVCAGKTLGDAYKANAILPTATFSDIAAAMALNNITINDLVVAIIGAAGSWSSCDPGPPAIFGNSLQGHLHDRQQRRVLDRAGVLITAHLPTGFFPVDGSAQFSVGNNPLQAAGPPHVVGNAQRRR
jgi:hypothetical protein